MSLGISLVLVIALIGIGVLAGHVAGLHFVFGVLLPYAALLVFLGGFIYRVIQWARVPVPFKIPTVAGQQKSLSFIRHDELEAPTGLLGVIGRMALEVLLFRSLVRNTRTTIVDQDGSPKVAFNSNLWLWGFGLAFHWSFLFVVVRHMRFFVEPVPFFVTWTEFFDGIMQIGVPVWYITDFAILGGLTFLFLRRLFSAQLRYISLPQDYFPLLLILGIATTGGLMRYMPVFRVDVAAVKELALGLASFGFALPEDPIGTMFFVHLFLVCSLLLYFPFSKLMHMGGVFLSPTRNMSNDNRMVRYESPMALEAHPHTYAEYEDEFRKRMVACGLPVDKPLESEEE